jgi:hypothetical protein
MLALFVPIAAAPVESSPVLRLEFALRGENGIVSIQDDAVSMHSSGVTETQLVPSREWRQAAPKVAAVTYRLLGKRFVPSDSHLDVRSAQRPGLCDRLNQIDISATSTLAGALPVGARPKHVIESRTRTLVVYSMSADPVRYDTWIAVLERLDHGRAYRLIQSEVVDRSGSFCGAYLLGADRYLVLVDAPAASADYLAAFVYAVAH